jgi:hypothetical protein
LSCTSITAICFETCTCGAAIPTPSYSRIVSIMSSISCCMSAEVMVSFGTACEGFRITGLPRRATFRIAIQQQ